jgi:tripartite-type tricarboxylate transporter receptor subunit TctC
MSNRLLPSSRRRRLSLGVAAAFASAAVAPGAGAQSETVSRLIVGYPAGGLADRLGRIVAEALSEDSSSSFIVENRPGAGGLIATEQVARADGDGKVLLLHNVDALTMERALKNDPGFDPLRSLIVVAPIARFEYLVVANAKLGLRNLQDLIALGRRSPTSIFYVDVGPGVRTVFESLKKKYGLNLVGVPYRGLAPAMTDLLEGRVGLAMLDGATAATHASSGRVTILGRADAISARDSSQVATLIEQGADGLWVDTRFALMAPSSTPSKTVEQLRALVTGTLNKPAVRARLEQSDYHPIDAAPEPFARSVAETVDHYQRLFRQAGML